MLIETLEGRMIAHSGDWIIRGIKGELYPCRSDIFEASYELVPLEICGNCRSGGEEPGADCDGCNDFKGWKPISPEAILKDQVAKLRRALIEAVRESLHIGGSALHQNPDLLNCDECGRIVSVEGTSQPHAEGCIVGGWEAILDATEGLSGLMMDQTQATEEARRRYGQPGSEYVWMAGPLKGSPGMVSVGFKAGSWIEVVVATGRTYEEAFEKADRVRLDDDSA